MLQDRSFNFLEAPIQRRLSALGFSSAEALSGQGLCSMQAFLPRLSVKRLSPALSLGQGLQHCEAPVGQGLSPREAFVAPRFRAAHPRGFSGLGSEQAP